MVAHIPASVFSAGLVLQGRYRLEETLASGGMAEVWRGLDLVLQRQVAIKLLHPHLAADSTIAERFRREAISAAKLSHPHIVPTYDAGAEDGIAFIVLGLVEGSTLADLLRRRKLTPFEATLIAQQVASALEHAHGGGLIHRDIKPANILLLDKEHRVLVADFGIAKAIGNGVDRSLTLPGFVVGTPEYVAPEQVMGVEADERTDIYAVGILLHQMVCRHVLTDEPTQASADNSWAAASWCEQLPPVLRPIVEQATAPRPDQRFQSAKQLQVALEDAGKSINPGNFAPTAPAMQQAQRAPVANPASAAGAPTAPTAAAIRQDAKPRARRRGLKVLVVTAALVASAVGIGRTVAEFGNQATNSPASATPTVVAIRGATSFDPFGVDKTENENQTAAVFDNRVDTAWSTETYATRTFGNLKPGIGLVISVENQTALRELTLESSSASWSASIFTSSDQNIPPSLEAWGAPLGAKSDISSAVSFDLHQQEATKVLLWITDLGNANRVSINEARLTS